MKIAGCRPSRRPARLDRRPPNTPIQERSSSPGNTNFPRRHEHQETYTKGIYIYRRDPCVSPSTYPSSRRFLLHRLRSYSNPAAFSGGWVMTKLLFLWGQGVYFHFSSYLSVGRPAFSSLAPPPLHNDLYSGPRCHNCVYSNLIWQCRHLAVLAKQGGWWDGWVGRRACLRALVVLLLDIGSLRMLVYKSCMCMCLADGALDFPQSQR